MMQILQFFCDRYEIWAPVHINPCWPLLTWRSTFHLPCALGMDTPWWASRGALDTIESTSFSRNANFWRDSRVQRCGFIGTNWEVQCMNFKNCHLIMWVYFAERGDFSYFFACWKICWIIQLVPNMSTISEKHLGLQIPRQFPRPWPSPKNGHVSMMWRFLQQPTGAATCLHMMYPLQN